MKKFLKRFTIACIVAAVLLFTFFYFISPDLTSAAKTRLFIVTVIMSLIFGVIIALYMRGGDKILETFEVLNDYEKKGFELKTVNELLKLHYEVRDYSKTCSTDAHYIQSQRILNYIKGKIAGINSASK